MQKTHNINGTNTSTASGNELYVWDKVVRYHHWSLVIVTSLLILSAEFGDESMHIFFGYLLILLISIRIVWGFSGTKHALFKDFIYPMKDISGYLRSLFSKQPIHYTGHNPAGGLMVVIVIGVLVVLGLSGLVMQAVIEFEGAFVDILLNLPDATAIKVQQAHHLLADVLISLIVVHISGVVASSWLHRENLIAAMIRGYKKENVNE
jgi:cytochrome b